MLILTRSLTQSIVVQDDDGNTVCNIRVIEVRGKQVRLGIDADGYKILRSELVEPAKDVAESA